MNFTPSEWITIAAILLGPIFAVVTQIVWQRWKEIRDQKRFVFQTLMSLRAQPLAPDYVRALNYIDVVFFSNEKVRQRWSTLLRFFESDAYKSETIQQETFDKARDLAAELMAEMAKELGYAFDHTQIKNNAYYPKFFSTLQTQTLDILRKSNALLDGACSLKVKVEETTAQPAPTMRIAPPRN